MLTVEEIENISFRRAGFGGYKVEDVDRFVDGVIEKVRQLELSNRELENRIEQLNKQVIKYEEQADSVQDAIITAEKTAKKLVRDASVKSETMMSEAETKSKSMVSEAEEKSYTMLIEAETRSQTILNSALLRSAAGIDENNRIIEQQKQEIIRIQSEVSRFREALIDSYKSHMKLINSLPSEEEFRQYQSKLDENYPEADPATPEAVEQLLREDADKAVEDAKEQTQIRVDFIDEDKVKEISEEIRTNTRAQAEFESESTEYGETLLGDNVVVFENSPEGYSDYEQSKNTDSNADDIMAAVRAAETLNNASDEPKPVSIDELDDGVIFSSSKAEEQFREEHNDRHPV